MPINSKCTFIKSIKADCNCDLVNMVIFVELFSNMSGGKSF